MSKFDCCICLENGLEIIMCRLPCQHKICLTCLCDLDERGYASSALANSDSVYKCPICRADFSSLIHKKISKKTFDVKNLYQFPPL